MGSAGGISVKKPTVRDRQTEKWFVISNFSRLISLRLVGFFDEIRECEVQIDPRARSGMKIRKSEKQENNRVILEMSVIVEWWSAKIRRIVSRFGNSSVLLILENAFLQFSRLASSLFFFFFSFSTEVENIADFPRGRLPKQGGARDKQVLGHNKGVSIHSPRFFSYANLAGGHPLGLFLQIFFARVYL